MNQRENERVYGILQLDKLLSDVSSILKQFNENMTCQRRNFNFIKPMGKRFNDVKRNG